MRVSDEELQEMVQQDDCQNKGCKRCNAIRDLRDLRKLAREAVELYHDPNLTTDGSIVEGAMGKLKAHLEEKP